MRCKKHFSDISSGVGVCASCLREKLFTLIAAQAQHTQQQQFRAQEERRKSDINPPPLVFPRSVSPYISRRSSDTSPWHHHNRSESGFSDQRFYFTPQVGPNNRKIVEGNEYSKKKNYKFSLFYNLFRSKSEKPDSDPVVSNSGGPCIDTSSSSTSWFSSILAGRRKKQNRTFSVDESTVGGRRRACRNCDRGMSPARYSDADGDEHCQGGSSGYSSESSQGWKQTPRRTPAVDPGRKSGGKSRMQRNVSGMTFCLSPLVRASPNRQWNQKGMPPDMVISGDIRVPVKSQSSTTSSLFCKNGSRKLADFGRANRNRRFRNS